MTYLLLGALRLEMRPISTLSLCVNGQESEYSFGVNAEETEYSKIDESGNINESGKVSSSVNLV